MQGGEGDYWGKIQKLISLPPSIKHSRVIISQCLIPAGKQNYGLKQRLSSQLALAITLCGFWALRVKGVGGLRECVKKEKFMMKILLR